MFFPQILTDPDFKYPDTPSKRAAAIADGLSGWGCCMAGATQPVDFGKGMVKIGEIVGITPTPENLTKAADEIDIDRSMGP